MDNAVAVQPTPLVVENVGLAGRLQSLPMRAKASLVAGVLGLAAILAVLAGSVGQGDLKPLYTGLSDKDGGAVVAQLAQMNVPYKVAGAGTILAPAGQIPDLRLKLATAGLPKGTTSGFELMDTARFGQTQFQERLTFQRGLEGELTRSIGSLSAVQSARVHLALPTQNAFFREQQKPSASVLLSLYAGRVLDRSQIAGIVHLVSSSVPELDPRAVSVLDQSGALLTAADGQHNAGLDAQQLQYVAQVESGYAKRIYELLEPLVGHDNLRATVTADVDFAQTEATVEEYKPNQGADATASVRSQQSSESGGGGAAAQPSGVPGAASNQPPVAATAPLTGASQPLQGAPQGGLGGGAGGRREAVTNYELDKTVRVTRASTGNVRRLNAAVVVNHRQNVDAAGKKTSIPLTGEELEKLTALVRETIGFKQDRGDSVKVINAPFKVETVKPVELPIWKDPSLLDLARSAATPAALAAVALLLLLGFVRPALRVVQASAPPVTARVVGGRLDAIENEPAPLPALPAPSVSRSAEYIENARQLARDNPAVVAGIVRDWVGAPAAAAPAAKA